MEETPPGSRRCRPGLGPRDRLVRALALAARTAIKVTGRGEGGTLPGLVAERLAPGILARAAGGLDRVVLVSGTNGKTTTTSLLTAALRGSGRRVVTNASGSNLYRGLVTTLLLGRHDGADAVLEVDEAVLPRAVEELRPDALVLLNLSRDQLDRHHEVRSLGTRWREAAGRLGPASTVVAVEQDPLVCHVAEAAPRVVVVGVPGAPLGRDSALCPRCGALLLIGGGGGYHCPRCAWAPTPRAVEVCRDGRALTLRGFGAELSATLPVASTGYALDAGAAVAAAVALGSSPATALASIAAVTGVQSRYAEVPFGGRRVRMLLAKNPAGWDEALTVADDGSRPAVVAINGYGPDGRDTSWVWDVQMDRLAGRPLVVATGARADDVALRLAVAGAGPRVMRSLGDALRLAAGSGPGVDLFADYTSFQEARRLLAQGGRDG